MKYYSIAIDGPSGAGKSTFAKKLAGDLSFVYVDTGAIYRTVGLYVKENGVESRDIEKIKLLLPEINIEVEYDEQGTQQMILNGRNVSKEIRMPEISLYASAVSSFPEVRNFLMELQRGFSRKYNVIMDGRDIGTVVLPNADLKIFLTAGAEARAKRRYDELIEKGVETTFDEVLSDMIKRDKDDSTRATAPLKQADDAVLVDTTELSLEESYEKIRSIVKETLEI